MDVEVLSDALGVRVSDLDLLSATSQQMETLRRLWLDRLVLVISGPVLSDDDYVTFAERFAEGIGSIKMTREQARLSSRREVKVISNLRENGRALGDLPDGEMLFHYDQMYLPKPNRAGILHGVDVPSVGGDTCFANTCLAYDVLPEPTRVQLEGFTCTHSFSYGATQPGAKGNSAALRIGSHPLVRTLPETGRKSLYLCRLMTDRINELGEAESQSLLNTLFDHIEKPEFAYQHRWNVGDVLIWDNFGTAHARTDFSPDQRRLLKRITVDQHDALNRTASPQMENA